MNRIVPDLRPGMQSPQVADLQDGLLLILDRRVLDLPDGDRAGLAKGVQTERRESAYRDTTAKTVSIVQEQRRIEPTGAVDRATADLLNRILDELGAFGGGTGTGTYLVAGLVTDEAGAPAPGFRVTAQHTGPEVTIRLGTDTTDAEGRYTVTHQGLPDGSPVRLRMSVSDDTGTVRAVSDVVDGTAPVVVVNLLVGPVPAARAPRSLGGTVVLDHGAPAAALPLRLYRRGFGGVTTLIGSATTSAAGTYAFSYDLDDRSVTLEVRAVGADGTEIPLSKPLTHMGQRPAETVSLVAPAPAVAAGSEYARLTQALRAHVGDLANLAKARENDTRQDLSDLNAATGWDARLTALAAVAQRSQADSAGALPAQGLYGLYRAGLPTDPLKLATIAPDTVTTALNRLTKLGIVGMKPAEIAEFRRSFVEHARTVRLGVAAPGSTSTYGDLLDTAGVGGARDAFAGAFLDGGDDDTDVWDRARVAKVPETTISRLQRHGKLAYLAGNSAPVTKMLMADLDQRAPVALVEQDLYDAAAWKAKIRTLAADEPSLAALIPPAYAGPDTQSRLDAYAEDMARKIRMSYPTEVVTRLIATDAIDVGGAKTPTVTLLTAATQRGFRLGHTGIDAFLAGGNATTAGLGANDLVTARDQIRTLHRVYQVTPTNEAMAVLMAMGLTSAYDISAVKEHEFTARFVDKYHEIHHVWPGDDVPRLVWRKAQQVSGMAYHIFGVAKKLDSDPGLPAISGSPIARSAAVGRLRSALAAYPTMESLFGSNDYCDCDDCRSVLSPAAYLVDLLQFLEGEPQTWANFLVSWKERNGSDYLAGHLAPYDALVARRPDLPHLELTCANTTTVMPYIDVVNEILEYVVANDTLGADAVRQAPDATSAELLAEPQNVIAGAYWTLLRERHPAALPFDLWLETVRAFCAHRQVSLPDLLDALRPGDELYAPARAYDRAAVFVERLGVPPAERAILTDPDPLASWWRLYGYPSAAAALTPATDPDTGQRTDLNSAKALSRRLGVTYLELADIIRSGFVNPKLGRATLLAELPATIAAVDSYLDPANVAFLQANRDLLGEPLTPAQQARLSALSTDDWNRLTDLAALDARIDAYAERFGQSGNAVRTQLVAVPFDAILVLADQDAGADFDATIVRYADGGALDGTALLRIAVLVRLWRRLGWKLDDLDRALCVLTPGATGTLDWSRRPLDTALIHLSHLSALADRLALGRDGRGKLLTLWSPLPTTGHNALYRQLFLTRRTLQADPIFDHPTGDYLNPAWVAQQAQGKPADFALVKGHLPAVQGALGLTPDAVGEILSDAGTGLDTAPLTIANLSILYRYAILAKALKLSPHDLITLKDLTGIDPFHPLHDGPLQTLADDHPYVDTIRFVDLVEEIRAAGFTVADLDFLVRRRYDEKGPYRRDPAATLLLLTGLADRIRAIEAEHALPADAAAVTPEYLQDELGLLAPPETVARLLRLIEVREVPAESTDDPAVRAFFDDHLRKQPVRLAGDAGFLDDADYPGLFAAGEKTTPVTEADTPEQAAAKRAANEAVRERNRAEAQRRRVRVAEAFLSVLRRRLIRDHITGTLAARADADPGTVTALLTDERLLSVAPDRAPLLPVFASAAGAGIDATFYASPDGTGAAQGTYRLASADTALRPSGAPAAGSARFDGYLVVPATGTYRFYLQLSHAGATGTLRLPHLADPVFLSGTAAGPDTELGAGAAQFVTLTAGVAYRFSLAVGLSGGTARLLVQGERTAKGPLNQFALYGAAALDAAARAYELLGSALQVIGTLGLTERETRYLLTHPANWGDVDLSTLPTAPIGNTPADRQAARRRFAALHRLGRYAALKAEIAAPTDDLIAVFEADAVDSADRLADGVYPLLAALTRRDPDVVAATAAVLFTTPAFRNDEPVRALWRALWLVERLGAPAAKLREWTGILTPDTGPADTRRFDIARGLRDIVKSGYDEATWLRVAQPIFDGLRKRQRDALVAYVMRRHGFTRQEQLYEYFLIDPGMEPVVQTSRIRMAISTVQLFVQRCLLNQEPQVHPSAIVNSDQWPWLKRYRVWEANRKIFLFPENWLEPEFRDDKSFLFTEIEGKLLADDVSADTVEDAFLDYLRKLEELARLDIVAMHLEDKPDFARNTLHVIGRTFGVPHKYFHRTYANRMWTPWEPISASIEGDHVVPVFWRDRLYLFWVTFMEQGEASGGSNTSVDTSKLIPLPGVQRVIEAQLHWTERLDGVWTVPESTEYAGPAAQKIRVAVPATFTPATTPVHVTVVPDPDPDEETLAKTAAAGVYISLGNPIGKAFYLAGRNSPVEPRAVKPRPANPFVVSTADASQRATRYTGSGNLSVSVRTRISSEPTPDQPITLKILDTTNDFLLLPANNTITVGVPADAYEDAGNPGAVRAALEAGIGEIEALMKPVFFQDASTTLFLEPQVVERTVEEWQEWVTRTPVPGGTGPAWLEDDTWWRYVKPQFEVPPHKIAIDPVVNPPITIHPDSVIERVDSLDWLANPATALTFDGVVVGASGRAGVQILTTGELSTARADDVIVTVTTGSAVAAGQTVVLKGAGSTAGLAKGPAVLTIVGAGGVNPALAETTAGLSTFGTTGVRGPAGPVR
ncbi:neuraminidase-like domain-containing protein [Micromonospora sp. NPDC005220]|uniref:neuraminidase-like domain-containing protein n=1 Tax=Micromonospora sp. NPDC005220 TaxID=3155589 RepID=UPI0033B73FF7